VILLDTDVASALFRLDLEPEVRAWLDAQEIDQLFLSTITIYELQRGIERMTRGRRRQRLEAQLAALLNHIFKGRLLEFDSDAALATARYQIAREKRGRPIDMADAMIAGIALSRRAALATRNIRHFAGPEIELINPWSDAR
jgi:hypothetical protein